MRVIIRFILCIIINIYMHVSPADLKPVLLKTHISFASASDASSLSESPPITISDLHREDVPTIHSQTTYTPESSPRIELGATPPSPPESEIARVRLSVAEERAAFGSLQEDRSAQLQQLDRKEKVDKLQNYLAKREQIISALGGDPQIAISLELQRARKMSQEYTEPSPGGSASMSPASSVTSSYSSTASSTAPSPKQSPLFAPMGSPSHRGSPSHHGSPSHRGAVEPYAAPPPLSGPKSLWVRGSSKTLISTALNALSPKSSDKQEKQ